MELNPESKIFGYVTTNQSISDFKTKVEDWNDLQIDGIFMDESGYDYGKTRSEFNERVDYVHHQTYAKVCFVNSWNFDHILGTENDVSFPNTIYNCNLKKSHLNSSDYCLLESFAINTTSYASTGGYESKTQWSTRGDKANSMRREFGINIVGCGIINDDAANGSDLFKFGFIAATMFSLDGYGISDSLYGASSAKSRYWERPDVSNIGKLWTNSPAVKVSVDDLDVYIRYTEFGKLILDFSSGSEAYAIISY